MVTVFPSPSAGGTDPLTLLASQAQAEAGAINTKLMSPLRTAQAIAVLAGAGISTPGIIYVQADGNDGTGELGNPAKPFLTGTAAWEAGQAEEEDFAIHFGAGSFQITCGTTGTDYLKSISGMGFGSSLTASVTQVTVGTSPGIVTNGNGDAAGSVDLCLSNLGLDVQANGGAVFIDDEGTYDGGAGGNVTLRGSGVVKVTCNGGGDASSANGTVNEGTHGNATLSGLSCQSVSGGNVSVDDCDLRSSDGLGQVGAYGDFTAGGCSHYTTHGIDNDRGGNAQYPDP